MASRMEGANTEEISVLVSKTAICQKETSACGAETVLLDDERLANDRIPDTGTETRRRSGTTRHVYSRLSMVNFSLFFRAL